jgi:hypothetical protein
MSLEVKLYLRVASTALIRARILSIKTSIILRVKAYTKFQIKLDK